MITISAFAWVPEFARGQVRDLRVRWALEEAGIPYKVRKLDAMTERPSDYFAEQPFGQVPSYRDQDVQLFESGAIVLHVAETHAGLLPDDANARARAIAWMFAAVSTVEPPIVERGAAVLLETDKPWYEARLPLLDDRVRVRLDQLSTRLGEADWLDGAFSAGDLLMVTVLRRLERSGLLEAYPNLCAYVARGEARPAYRRAFEDQLAVFTAASGG